MSESSSDTVDYDAWRDHLTDGTLLGVQCDSCGHVSTTPKRLCPSCSSRELEGIELPARGTVYSETKINVPPEGFDGRYQVAVVDLGDARILGRIDGSIDIGDTVEFGDTIQENGHPAPVFSPVD
jgi:uncharacterized OB-fold protein